MTTFWIILGCVVLLAIWFFVAGWIIVLKTFKTDKNPVPWALDSPAAHTYQPFEIALLNYMEKTLALFNSKPREKATITAFDGLPLSGYVLPSDTGSKKVAIFNPGYVVDAWLERDISMSAMQLEYLDYNMVAHAWRGLGKRVAGKWFTYGWYERKDVKSWAEFAVKRFGEDCEVYLTGASVGAFISLLTACSEELPPQVKGIIFVSGFNSLDDLMLDVARDRRDTNLPPIFFAMLHFFSKLYLGIDFKKLDILNLYSNLKIPVLFVNGSKDTQIPPEKFKKLVDSCPTPHIVEVYENSAHATCSVDEPERYLKMYASFVGCNFKKKKSDTPQ